MTPKVPQPPFHLKKIEANGAQLILIARDSADERWTVMVNGFKPYFMVLDTKENRATCKKRGLPVTPGRPSIFGDQTLKLVVDTPMSVPKRRKGFEKTFEADVPYTRRFLVDTGIHDGFEIVGEHKILAQNIIVDYQNLRPVSFRTRDRQLLYDIETNKPEGSKHYSPPTVAEGPVTAFSFHDSFDEAHVHTYYWHPFHGTPGRPKTEQRSQWSDAYQRHIPWTIRTFGTEEEMHVAILQYLKANRPDVMQAWNGHHGHHRKNGGGFDAPYMINRLKRIGISAGQLSPLGSAVAGRKMFGKEATQQGKGKWVCAIDGVQLIDGMTTYQIKEGGFTAQVPFSDLKRVTEKFTGKKVKKDPNRDFNCVGENHLILRPDLTWTRAGDLKVGDQVASFDEGAPPRTMGRPKNGSRHIHPKGGKRKYRIGTVTHNDVQEMAAFEVHLDDGSVVTTTAIHPWLSHSTGEKVWIETRHLKAGQQVSKMTDVHEVGQSRSDGWLSGMFDGEGSLVQNRTTGGGSSHALTVSIGQRPGPVLERLESELSSRGFEYQRQENHNSTGLGKGDCVRLVLKGGREENLRFLMQVRPDRLSAKFDWTKLGQVQIRKNVRVTNVIPVGMRRIARLSVDCETYIADGFLMHNTWWLDGTEEFLTYSFNDVDALVILEQSEGYLAFARDMQQFVGCEDANRLFTPMSLINTMLLRIALEENVCVPSSEKGDAVEGEDDEGATGGFVLDPQQTGLQEAVCTLDLTTMYVHIIISGNISPETHVPNPTEEQLADLICMPSDLGPQFFLKPEVKVGILPKLALRFKAKREYYDDLIAATDNAEEVKKLKHQRQPAKQLLLGVWGTSLSEHFCLNKRECGSSITGTGRFVILNTREFVKQNDGFVTYVDTDSNLCRVPWTKPKDDGAVEYGEHLSGLINQFYDRFTRSSMNMDRHGFEIGLETIYHPFVQGQQKKQYAGLVVWSEGKWQIDETGKPLPNEKTGKPRDLFTQTGVSGMKSDAAPITRETTEAVLRAILNKAPPLEIVEYVRSVHEAVLAGDIPLDQVIKAVGMNMDPDDPDPEVQRNYIIRGVRHGRDLFDFEYVIGARVRVMPLKDDDQGWLAIPDGEDLPEEAKPLIDMDELADATVLRPVQNVLDWVGLEIDSVRYGTKATAQRRL